MIEFNNHIQLFIMYIIPRYDSTTSDISGIFSSDDTHDQDDLQSYIAYI